MTTEGKATIFRHGKAATLYVSIPSKMACDSIFPLKAGDRVTICLQADRKGITVRKVGT